MVVESVALYFIVERKTCMHDKKARRRTGHSVLTIQDVINKIEKKAQE